MSSKKGILWGIVVGCLFISGSWGETAVAQTAVSSLHLTLVPNYENHRIDIVGRLSERACTDVPYDWFQNAQEIPPLYPDESEGHCLFRLSNQGEIIVQDEGIYQLYWPELTLNEGDELTFVVPAADILFDQMSPKPQRGWQPFHWQLTGSDIKSGLLIPIHPWQFDINLTVNTLLPTAVNNKLNSDTLLSGEVTISDIQDTTSYQWLTRQASSKQHAIDMLMTVVDYVPIQSSDTFPGFVDLALHKQRAVWFQSHITTAQPPHAGQGGKIQFTIIGRTYPLQITHPSPKPLLALNDLPPAPSSESSPPDSLDNNRTERIVLGTVRLAPQDTLRLWLPDNLIVQTTPPPSQRPNANSLIYQGPAQFTIEVSHTPTGMMLLKQFPIVIRSFALPLEDTLAEKAKESQLAALVVALSVFVLAMAITRRYGQRWQSARPFFIIWLITGTALLYFTPAISSLLLLSLVVLQPYFRWRHPGEAIIVVLLTVTVVLDNVLVWLYPVTVNGERQHINFYTPIILLCFSLLSLGIIAARWQDVTARLAESERQRDGLSVVYLPALTMGFMVLATYEIINQSFFSFVIVVAITALTQRFTQRTPTQSELATVEPLPVTTRPIMPVTKRGWGILVSYERGHFTLSWRPLAETAVPPPENKSQSTHPQKEIEPVLAWFYTLRHLLQRPSIIAGTIILALCALSLVTNTLNNLAFSLVTLLATIILFVILYELIPTSVGYYKAIGFVIPFIAIFLLGIGTTTIPLSAPASTTGHYILFLNQLDELLLGRIIYYLSVPLFIGLYLEFNQQRRQGKVTDIRQFLTSVRSLMPLATAVLSALTPTLFQLFTEQPVITTFADLIEQFLIISGS